ncbi:MAG: GAF domain-containing protein [Bdellovibrionales bacterium]|nr:GAF domain-containing protein [Bdellovibrionales bacterium]
MTEELQVSEGDRASKYEVLIPQVQALLSGEPDLIANLANMAAAIHQTFGFLWVGFYRNIGEQLVLGPFQGPIACSRIRAGEGVCGACVARGQTIIVPDVEKFPGHIACSSSSRSEIVVPLIQHGEVKLVLDVDSDQPDDFDAVDQAGLEKLVALLDERYPAPHPLLRAV